MKQQYILSILKQIPIITMFMTLYTRCSLRNEKKEIFFKQRFLVEI